MHEWLIAESIAEIAKGKKVKIFVGELQGIDIEVLKFALERKRLKFEIIEEKAVLKCNVCGHEWSPSTTGKKDEAIHFIPEIIFSIEKCPKCGSRDFEIIKGRGVRIEECND